MAIRSNDVANTSRQNKDDFTETQTNFGATRKGHNAVAVTSASENSIRNQANLMSGHGWLRRWFNRTIGASALSIGAAGLLLCSSTGCTMTSGVCRAFGDNHLVDDFMVNYRNKAMAEKAWHCQKDRFCNHKHAKEFKGGFIDGFMAVANGGNGCTPKVAPQQYWGWRYQSAQGNGAVSSWFEGYPMGVAAAEEAGIGEWSQVRTMGGLAPGAGMPASTVANPFYAQPVDSHQPYMDGQPYIEGQPIMQDAPYMNSAPVEIDPLPISGEGGSLEYQFDNSLGSKPIFDDAESLSATKQIKKSVVATENGDEDALMAEALRTAQTIVNESSDSADAVIAGLPNVSSDDGNVSLSFGDSDLDDSELENMFGSDAADLEDDGSLPFSFE
ncbi:hypothetical protein N9N28_14420 [Rubripirellula amarantea]|nr:hypothetical protein [Rubripirellula amarantea]